MNLYHVKRIDDTDYDEFSDFVVAALNEEEAACAHPRSGYRPDTPLIDWSQPQPDYNCWVSSRDKLTVAKIGTADAGVHGVICASFHAG